MNQSSLPTLAQKLHAKAEKKPKNIFLHQLYSVLQNERNSHVITWSEDGSYFIVDDLKAFSEEILPSIYNHQNVSSFTRQLNMYGFRKVISPEGTLAYSNPSFKRHNLALIDTIVRMNPRKKRRESQKEEVIMPELQPLLTEKLRSQQKNIEEDLESKRLYLQNLRTQNFSLKEEFAKQMIEEFNDMSKENGNQNQTQEDFMTVNMEVYQPDDYSRLKQMIHNYLEDDIEAAEKRNYSLGCKKIKRSNDSYQINKQSLNNSEQMQYHYMSRIFENFLQEYRENYNTLLKSKEFEAFKECFALDGYAKSYDQNKYYDLSETMSYSHSGETLFPESSRCEADFSY
jgi:hypothetical protein